MGAGNRQGIEAGFGLMDLFGLLWRARVWIVVVAAVGALAAAGLSAVLPKRWTATALVQIGQIGRIQSAQQGADVPELVENPSRAVERARNPPFVEEVLRALGLTADDGMRDPTASLIRSSLRVNLRRGSDLIEIQVDGSSRGDARKHAEAFVSRLAAAHAQIAEPGIQRLRGQLKLVETELSEAAEVRKQLRDAAAALGGRAASGQKFSERVLLGSLMSEQEARIALLRESKLKFEEQLSPRRTFPTALLTAVHVPARHASPRLMPLALVGAVLGGGLGLLARVARRNA